MNANEKEDIPKAGGKMTVYFVVKATSFEVLENLVSEYKDEGCVFVGGFAFRAYDDYTEYYQAMYREIEDEKKEEDYDAESNG